MKEILLWKQGMIPLYLWLVGAIGIFGIIIYGVSFLREINQPLTLEPSANRKQLRKNDRLYQSFLKLDTQPLAQVYQTCLAQHQQVLIDRYLTKIFFSFGLLMITISYLISEKMRLYQGEDSLWILIGLVILPISWTISFFFRIYSMIFVGLLASWGVYALSLSGHDLPPDTLLLFTIIIYFIAVCIGLISNAQKEKSEQISLVSLLAVSIIIIFALGLIRYFLPWLGSFTILLVIPAIALLSPALGCWGFFLPIPSIIGSAIAEQLLLSFPNSLLVSCFFSLDLILVFILITPVNQVKSLLDRLSQCLGLTQENTVPFPCKNCGSSMEYLDRAAIDNYLSYPQQVARSIDSMEYFAWRCPQCYQSLQKIHLRGYYMNNKTKFANCPTCQELTMVCRKSLASESQSNFLGIKVNHKNFHVERKCACCDFTDSYTASTHYIN